MDLIILYGSVIIAGIIVGRNARTLFQVLLVLTSTSFVLLTTSLVLYYHFVYATELLIMLGGFILLFMILIVHGKSIFISLEDMMENVTAMIYNMLIVYVLTLGGLVLSYRLMYPLENPYVLPYVEYISYPLLFGLLLILLLWIIRFIIQRTNTKKHIKTKGTWMIVVICIVFIFNAFNILYQDNPYEMGNAEKSLFEDIEFYETYDFASVNIPMEEGLSVRRLSGYYYTEDSLYIVIEYENHLIGKATYIYYRLSLDTLQLIDSDEMSCFSNFIGETDSTIVYIDDFNTIHSLDGLIDFDVYRNPEYYEILNNQIRILVRHNSEINEYVYDIDSKELTLTEDIVYERNLYNVEGEVIASIKETNIIYEDDDVMYFVYLQYSGRLYQYKNEEITLFNEVKEFYKMTSLKSEEEPLFKAIQEYYRLVPTKYGILLKTGREASVYNSEAELIGQVELYDGYSAFHINPYLLNHDVLEDGTYRYVSVEQEYKDTDIIVSYKDLHSPHIPIYLQYFMSPYVGLFLLVGILPFNKSAYLMNKK